MRIVSRLVERLFLILDGKEYEVDDLQSLLSDIDLCYGQGLYVMIDDESLQEKLAALDVITVLKNGACTKGKTFNRFQKEFERATDAYDKSKGTIV